MNLYFRLITSFIGAFFTRVPDDFRSPTRWSGHIYPTDIDIYGHMNNGRYLTIAGLAAMHNVLVQGLLMEVLNHRYIFIFNRAEVKWYRPLKLLRRFTVDTSIVSWEGSEACARSTFYNNRGKIAAEVLFHCILKSGKAKQTSWQDIINFCEQRKKNRITETVPQNQPV